jgi:hypothetical protein
MNKILCPILSKELIVYIESVFNKPLSNLTNDINLTQNLLIQMGKTQVVEHLKTKYKYQTGRKDAFSRIY